MDGTENPVVFSSIKNFGELEDERLLTIYLNEQEADYKTIKLLPGEEQKIRFKPYELNANVQQTTNTIRLELSRTNSEDEDDSSDFFAIDDQAFGVINPPKPLRILFVSHGNYFLETLLKIIPNAVVEMIAPNVYTPLSDYNVTIFDNFSPPQLTRGNYLFINQVPQGMGFIVNEELSDQPLIVDWNRIHLLTRYVNFDNIKINQALKFESPAWTRTLLESQEGSLIETFNRNQINALVIGFDPNESDWVLRPSFPLFFFNAIRWLTSSQLIQEQPVLKTGIVLPLVAESSDQVYTIKDPKGETHTIVTEGKTQPFSKTNSAGFYQISSTENPEPKTLAFNLLSLSESEIAPKKTLQLGREIVQVENEILKTNQEIWKWFIWAALIVLLIEWFIYCRRTWV